MQYGAVASCCYSSARHLSVDNVRMLRPCYASPCAEGPDGLADLPLECSACISPVLLLQPWAHKPASHPSSHHAAVHNPLRGPWYSGLSVCSCLTIIGC
jgi:hypothetical protein